MTEPFELRNDPPPTKRLVIEAEPCRQRLLLDGLDDCAGQLDLFNPEPQETTNEQTTHLGGDRC